MSPISIISFVALALTAISNSLGNMPHARGSHFMPLLRTWLKSRNARRSLWKWQAGKRDTDF